jgi:hypothetical protein
VDEDLKNLIIATPVVGVLIFYNRYFMGLYEKEKSMNRKSADQDSKIIEGMDRHINESNKKHDETNLKIDSIIRTLDK